MNTNPSTSVTARFLTRRYVEVLTGLTLLFVLQTGLVPFRFSTDPSEAGGSELYSMAGNHLTFPDLVSNVFLYVPLGVLVCWTLCRWLGSRALAWFCTVMLAGAMSLAVEYVQHYSAARVSSAIDVIGNLIGATLGASITVLAGRILPRLLGAALYEFHKRPTAAVAKTYCLVLFIFAAVPFSFTFDVMTLKQSVKTASFVPFGALASDSTSADRALEAENSFAYATLRWRQCKLWSRWSAEGVSFAVLGWLLYAMLRGEYRFGRRTAAWLTLYQGGFLAVGLTLVQLVVLSRTCDVTDVLFRWLGLAGGLSARAMYMRDRARLAAEADRSQWRRLCGFGCAATVAYILYTGLIPWVFDATGNGLATSLASEGFLPFFAYFLARFDLMMDDVMEKFASYVVLSALLVTYLSQRNGHDYRSRWLWITAWGVALSGVIEFAQMFQAVRVASLTDPILAAAGCFAGVVAQRHAATFCAFARSEDMAKLEAERERGARTPELSPLDALVATLTEPHPDAPVEPSPQRTPRRSRHLT